MWGDEMLSEEYFEKKDAELLSEQIRYSNSKIEYHQEYVEHIKRLRKAYFMAEILQTGRKLLMMHFITGNFQNGLFIDLERRE